MTYLIHHGIKGQKWGVRRFRNEDGTLTAEGKIRRRKEYMFVSGSSKMQSKEDGYYREKLPKTISDFLDNTMQKKSRVLIGDAPGADTMVQQYLADKGYLDVHVYVSGDDVRFNAGKNLGWKVHHIDSSEFEFGSKEWHATKDKAMSTKATSGMAIILDEGAKATRKNIDRLIDSKKDVFIYQLDNRGDAYDKWIPKDEYKRIK